MAADSTVFLRRDPVSKQWVTVPLADPAGDRLFMFNGSSSLPEMGEIGTGLTYDDGVLQLTGGNSPEFEAITVTGTATIGYLQFSNTVWDDLRILPSAFDMPGVNDPTLVSYQPGLSGNIFRLWEFANNDEAFVSIQMPHSYKTNGEIRAHVHWNPGQYGVAQRNNTVGWKLNYTCANINGVFAPASVVDLSDAIPSNCANDQHLMSPSVGLTIPSGFGPSGMILMRVFRTDTGADDTWSETLSGRLPMLLELDLHFEMDKIGSNNENPFE